MSPQIIFLINKSLESIRNFHFDSAELYLKQILRLQSKNHEALRLLGVIYAQQKKYNEAKNYFNLSLNSFPKNALVHSNLGNVFFELKDYEKALNAYDKAITIAPKYEEAWSNRGNVLHELGRLDEALACHDKAIELKPNYAEAWSNKGAVLHKLHFFEEAILCHNESIRLKPNHAEAWLGKGIALHELNHFEEALFSFSKANEIKPNYAEAWGNRGASLHESMRYTEAVIAFDHAISLKPDYAEALANKAACLRELGHYEDALSNFEKAISLKTDIDWMYGNYLATKTAICNWNNLNEAFDILARGINKGLRTSSPFPVAGIFDDPFIQKKAAEIYIKERYPANESLGPIKKYKKNNRVKIGYFSADFHNHATTYLMAELFELHNKDRFELIAFSFGPVILDNMRERLLRSFDQFIDVEKNNDLEVVQLSRRLQVDIAIDLKGFTLGSRPGIFAYRVAPVQVSYLGYPGTMGASYIDYIIADKILIPSSAQKDYSEKIVYLPNSYQVNDSGRLISNRQFTKQELGLPDDSFVFCSFNNSYKIRPDIYDIWMKILKAVNNSVLWLLADNQSVMTNLKNEAIKRGVREDKIIFAERMPLADHLARHQHADLFLDTTAYNAHTTASDALWAGLPVLTLIGQSFPTRVAASLLNAIGMPELITYSQDAYEALAIELAMNPMKLAEIKQKLTKNRLNTPLFNTALFTKHLESAYTEIYQRYHSNLPPDHIYV